MPRIPPTSAKWYLYEISRMRLHRGKAKKSELSNFKYNWKTDLWKIFSHLSPTLEKNGCFMPKVSGDLEGLAGLSGGGTGVARWVVRSLWTSWGHRALVTDQGKAEDVEAVLGWAHQGAAELRPGQRTLCGSSGKSPAGR